MGRYFILIEVLLLIVLFASCGQVGIISGGPVDKIAPKPIMEEVAPPMASLNTYPDEIRIPFDEFIALNKPSENIRVVPDDVKLEPSIRKKTLVLKPIKGEWKDNTTYAIYLKRAVKDITEANDSIMSFVFSTGDYIDSLVSQVRVIDAFDGKPVKDINVGLYSAPFTDDTSKVFPRYIAITDENGVAQFNYLMDAPFYVYAFKDENKNNQLDPAERRGRLAQQITGTVERNEDSIPEIRLMPPAPRKELKIRTNEVDDPPYWKIGFGQRVRADISISYPEDKQPKGERWSDKGDSVVLIYGPSKPSDRYTLYYDYRGEKDTLNKKFLIKKERKYDFETNLSRGVLLIGDTLSFRLNQAIDLVNRDKIQLEGVKKEDTIRQEIPYDVVRSFADEVQFFHARDFDSIYLTMLPGAVNGYDFKLEDTLSINYLIQGKEKVGELIIRLDTIPPYGIFQMLNEKGEVLKELDDITTRELTFPNLQPGNYKFRYILDENRDGKWTTGDIFEGTDAEYVLFFKDALTVRANWDVKGELEFLPLLNTIGLFLPPQDNMEENDTDEEEVGSPEEEIEEE
jgi:uncharacterized protein (DUF2141 family)